MSDMIKIAAEIVATIMHSIKPAYGLISHRPAYSISCVKINSGNPMRMY